MDPKVSKSLGVSLFHPASAWVWSLLSPELLYSKTPQAIAAQESNFFQTSILPWPQSVANKVNLKRKHGLFNSFQNNCTLLFWQESPHSGAFQTVHAPCRAALSISLRRSQTGGGEEIKGSDFQLPFSRLSAKSSKLLLWVKFHLEIFPKKD